MTLTDRDRAVGHAGVADARHELEHARCPGTGQLVGAARGQARCAHCREQVATEMHPAHGERVLAPHSAPVRRRPVCAFDGCGRLTPSALHRWCSVFHHRLDVPAEYDDRLAEA